MGGVNRSIGRHLRDFPSNDGGVKDRLAVVDNILRDVDVLTQPAGQC